MKSKTFKYLVIIFLVLYIAWHFAARQPNIVVQYVDSRNKRIKVRIGAKTYTWQAGKGSLEIPKVNFGYSATIAASSPYSVLIKVKRYGTTVKQEEIKFI